MVVINIKHLVYLFFKIDHYLYNLFSFIVLLVLTIVKLDLVYKVLYMVVKLSIKVVIIIRLEFL